MNSNHVLESSLSITQICLRSIIYRPEHRFIVTLNAEEVYSI